MDYYGLLGITKNADDLEIKKAFKRVSLHLAQRLENEEEIQEVFVTVAEAYDVLSDKRLRATYDQYGEEGLKRGLPISQDDYVQPYTYHGEYMRTYEEFYATTSPYADILDAQFHPPPIYDLPEGKGIKTKPAPFIRPVYCSLEEVFQGCLKKIKIKRRELIPEGGGRTEMKEKIFEIPIKPGLPEGTEILFQEEGEQGPTIITGDVIFKLKDKDHPLYVRDGVNLKMTVHVTLQEALTGTTVKIVTVDERIIRIPIHDIIHPNFEKVVLNEGMPLVDDTSKKGDLYINFKVDFPQYLPRVSKNMIKKALQVAKETPCSGITDVNKMILMDKMNKIPKEEQLPGNCVV